MRNVKHTGIIYSGKIRKKYGITFIMVRSGIRTEKLLRPNRYRLGIIKMLANDHYSFRVYLNKIRRYNEVLFFAAGS